MKYYPLLLLSVGIFLIFSHCRTGRKYPFDSNKISIGYYYGQFGKNEKIFVRFDSVNEILSGSYFFVQNKALVKIQNFSTKPNEEELQLLDESNNLKFRIIKWLSANSDSIVVETDNLNIKDKRNNKLTLYKEPEDVAKEVPARYQKPIFDKVKTTTIKYGSARGYYKSKLFETVNESNYGQIMLEVGKNLASNILLSNIELDMDIYEAIGDTIKSKPLILLIHGGSFLIGDKKSETMTALAEYYTKMGYVTASVNYRLGFIILPNRYDYMERSIYRALQDCRAALRYLAENASAYKLNTNQFYVAGTSAGGFTTLNLAYMQDNERYASTKGNKLLFQDDLGCIDCSTNKLTAKYNIKGIVNMWGALTDIKILDEKDKIPALHIHGDNDDIVPMTTDLPFKSISPELSAYFTKPVYGSQAIHNKATKLKMHSELIILKGAGHEPQLDENNKFTEHFSTIKQETTKFFFGLLKKNNTTISGKETISKNDQIVTYSSKESIPQKCYWSIKGGKIIGNSTNTNTVYVVWFNDANKGQITLLEYNTMGSAYKFEKTIDINPME
jgi:alpha/beta superfamily hydrolase